jgi:hypothetical protein
MPKGAFKYSEISGSKCMSKSQGILKSAQGKMSSAHGVVPCNTKNNMTINAGNAVGHGCRPFRSGLLPTAAPGHGAGHKSQPKGHK